MNLQYLLLNDKKTVSDTRLNNTLALLAAELKLSRVKFSEKKTMLGDMGYYHNALPIVAESRDLLKKTFDICDIYVNWKKKDFEGLDIDQICKEELKKQYGFCVSFVDKGYTRNNFKNKETVWVIYDNKNTAEKALAMFNKMFRTAIEQDAIDEYKHFKQNPMKRPLTYDKLIDNAYELYDLVDKGEE